MFSRVYCNQSVCPLVHPSVCLSVYKILLSVKALVGVSKSHSVTALVVYCLLFPKQALVFLRVCITSVFKTLLEKEKLVITSNFSFSHSVFYPFGELSITFINLKLSSANSFSLEVSKIGRLGKG